MESKEDFKSRFNYELKGEWDSNSYLLEQGFSAGSDSVLDLDSIQKLRDGSSSVRHNAYFDTYNEMV